jgi:hypothetical protein
MAGIDPLGRGAGLSSKAETMRRRRLRNLKIAAVSRDQLDVLLGVLLPAIWGRLSASQ